MEKGTNKAKIIFHIDMNAFFCSVACIKNPELRGKPFAIGRENSTKGVLSTASYEARKYGIHSAMPQIDAMKLLPNLIIIQPNFEDYKYYHYKFINLIKEYTDIIEVASIDELYADMTEASKTKHPIVLAKEIQERLLGEYKLPCSIGIAPTLFLAKMGSDIKKPLGVTVIRKREIEKILYPLSVSDIFGIGKKTWPKLIENGINTIGDFMDINNKNRIIDLIGINSYEYVINHVKGNSSDIVEPNRYDDAKSISECETYDNHKGELTDLILELRKLARSVINRMIKNKYVTKTINITLRDSSFHTITRQRSLEEYTDDQTFILNVAMELLEDNFIEGQTYRLLGFGVSNLVLEKDAPRQYNLFTLNDKDLKENEINKMIKEFQNKYGNKALYFKKDEK